MAHTVVSVFENLDHAQKAQALLVASGFSKENITIRSASYKTDSSSEHSDSDEGIVDTITDFFKNLFGGEDEQINEYAKAAQHGVLISVHTENEQDAAKAASIFDTFSDETSQDSATLNSSARHAFTDDPLNPLFSQNHNHGGESRASRLKSRIVERSMGK